MKKIIIFSCLSMFTLLIPFLSLWAEPIAIITNKANDINDLNSSFLAKIFMGKAEKWSDGQKVFVVDHSPDSEIRFQFYKIVLNSKPKKKFLKPQSPVPFKAMTLKTDVSTRKFVGRIPNAIGYIYLKEVNDKVKVLKVDGKLPGDEGYIIR
ncbi:MAG: hypothetical protein GY797_01645 [Deltaproteobacteria bacterium]|nr:hypothetical protein [Deltaproteobacteria bacterium]